MKKTKGQPTDKKGVNEDDEQSTGWVETLVSSLLGPEFDGSNVVVFIDKAFTSLRLVRKLFGRGIHTVGMMRAVRPKKMAKGKSWADYWPFRKYEREDEGAHARGWQRHAYTPMPDTRWTQYQGGSGGGWVQASVWRDRRFVTFLSTTFFSETGCALGPLPAAPRLSLPPARAHARLAPPSLAGTEVLRWTQSAGKRLQRTFGAGIRVLRGAS